MEQGSIRKAYGDQIYLVSRQRIPEDGKLILKNIPGVLLKRFGNKKCNVKGLIKY